ncbi:hypothetical protein A1OO_12145 [Enterovibrio norvegicus FF-33]|uniref:DUF1107 domain-containing protein n=1 Tax=Enterovibrio norvegicus FF-454 TaxID=1185651 RepID=A0A1E5C8S4_9GAMM|nr:DUF1107 family protein [Enterovibrio norvegicus]OEE61865.1 hypothetical protein A1OK_08160 [Enterovibrio norvegicus FF-454]OEE68370.1 hypothetical protein A1OO_12145 [Enterovibrio norvegicus FF-33]OEE75485.1 hypothetical protein A1OQ_22965 [Enterovibrio norvegicus FF-162]
MRMFNRYFPTLIAKHVYRLFNGRIYIDGRGDFDFHQGMVQAQSDADFEHYRTVKEINAEIRRLKEQC